jgi:hypothetical protein
MDLLHLILIVIVANVMPFPLPGVSHNIQNILLSVFAVYLGCDSELNVIFYDGTITMYGNISYETVLCTSTTTMDNAPVLLENRGTQAHGFRKLICLNKAENTVSLYMDLLDVNYKDVRVYIDGYIADYDVVRQRFTVDLNASDMTPRIDNTDPSNREVFNGITFEVRTNGVPLKHLKFM